MKTELSGEIHCGYCNAPIEFYQPFKFFDSDRGCELYSKAFEIVWDYSEMPFQTFYEEMLKVQDRFPEVEQYKELCQEIYEIFEDTGVIAAELQKKFEVIKGGKK